MRLDAPPSGESALIERVAARCSLPALAEAISVVRGIGDDTAVLQVGEQTLLWTADMLLEGVHFRLDWIDAASLGWKALAVNLSDIAAMGGEPIGALLSMALPPERRGAWLDAFLDGFTECARAYNTALIGGDTNRAAQTAIDVSVFGHVEGAPVLRSGAQAGDWLMVTGALGGSRAGLDSLLAGKIGLIDLTPHFRPTPRLQVGVLARQLGASAMMDLSDGLAADLPKLLRASGKGAVVYADQVPVHPVALQSASTQGIDPTQLALLGGEDYELLIAAPPEVAQRLLGQIPEATGVALSVIGEVIAAPELWLQTADGRRESFALLGWDHFPE
ncbi:MAG: thiamine-monophosphate kinase [Fimbriimonadales bacterium]|nr:MAG: thiamine-monophosphate kinase [Fimbriimonadales bacterium]